MENGIMINKDILIAILNTLNQIDIKGYDNLDRMYGTMRTIQQILQQPKVGEEDGNNK